MKGFSYPECLNIGKDKGKEIAHFEIFNWLKQTNRLDKISKEQLHVLENSEFVAYEN